MWPSDVGSAAGIGEEIQARQAEIEDVRPTFRVDQDVARLEVAVTNSLGVSVFDRLGDAGDQIDRLADSSAVPPAPQARLVALDELRDQVVRRSLTAVIEELNDP